MRRGDDLTTAVWAGWMRLNSAAARDRFFDEFLRAAVQLERRGLRRWLRYRLRSPPLGEPADLSGLAITDADIAALLAMPGEGGWPGRS